MNVRPIIIVTILSLFIGAAVVFAAPNFKLPYTEGESWILTNGYGVGKNPDETYHKNNDLYALDFTLSGCEAFNKPVRAVALGTVKSIKKPEESQGYGNTILIDHGEGFISRYAHLNTIGVNGGQSVTQGQEIGTAGNTGNFFGGTCKEHPGTHLHFALYKDGKAYEPKGMSGYQAFNENQRYKSDNKVANAVWKTLQGETWNNIKYSLQYPSDYKVTEKDYKGGGMYSEQIAPYHIKELVKNDTQGVHTIRLGGSTADWGWDAKLCWSEAGPASDAALQEAQKRCEDTSIIINGDTYYLSIEKDTGKILAVVNPAREKEFKNIFIFTLESDSNDQHYVEEFKQIMQTLYFEKQSTGSENAVQKANNQDLGVTITASADKKKVKFTILKTEGISFVDYEITYQADPTAQEKSLGRDEQVKRGIIGDATITSTDKPYESSWFDLGVCKNNSCRYDMGVQSVDLLLQITTKDGTRSLFEKTLNLAI